MRPALFSTHCLSGMDRGHGKVSAGDGQVAAETVERAPRGACRGCRVLPPRASPAGHSATSEPAAPQPLRSRPDVRRSLRSLFKVGDSNPSCPWRAALGVHAQLRVA